MSQPVQGPDGKMYQFPEGTTKDVAIKYFKSKGIGGSKPQAPTGSISATKPPSGMMESVERSAQQFMNDLRHGTDITTMGSLAKKMGAQPLSSGQPEGVGDMMGSPILGPTRMVKGASEIGQSGKRWQGTKDVVGGALEAGQFPGMFMAPEATSAAKGLLPSTEKAGKLLESVEQVAGKIPVDLKSPLDAAKDIVQNAKSGGTRPKVVADFMRRIADPSQPPLTFAEARRFYENAISKFATDIQGNPLKGKPRYMLGKFTKALDQSIQGAAKQSGVEDQYVKAMKSYRNAAQFESAAKTVGKKAKQGAGLAAGGAATAMGAKAGYNWLTK